jgi:hypothetical protein
MCAIGPKRTWTGDCMSLIRAASLPCLWGGYGPSGNFSGGGNGIELQFVRLAHEGATPRGLAIERSRVKSWRRIMMQKIACSTIQAWLLSVAILILGAHYNVARAAQDNPKKTRTAVACGKEIKKQCGGGAVGVPVGVPTGATSVLACFQQSQKKLSARCAALANNVFRSCDRDAAQVCQGVVAGSQGNIVGCLTMAKHMVSSQCNAALDAASLR